MNLEFIELQLEWSSESSIYDLKNLILSELLEYGDPLRWAITSINSLCDEKPQIISVEAVLIMHQDKVKCIRTN